MGNTERILTAVVMAIVFAAGLYVVIFAPLIVNEREDGTFYITDYSFTKGEREARSVSQAHCAQQGKVVTDLTIKKTWKRASNQFGREYRFSCGD